MQMKFILLATATLAVLVAMISVRWCFPFEGHPNTEWIISVIQTYLCGNGEP